MGQSSSGGGNSDPKLRYAGSQQRGSVNVKNEQSLRTPYGVSSGGGEPSHVTTRCDQAIKQPLHLSSGSTEPSHASIRKDQSVEEPLHLRSGGGEPSRVSMRSKQSVEEPIHLSSGGGEPRHASVMSKQSVGQPIHLSSGGEPSRVSMRNKQFVEQPINPSSGGQDPSCVFLRSDESVEQPIHLSSGRGEPSYVSTRSKQSIEQPIHLSSGEPSCVFPRSDEFVEQPVHLSSGGGDLSCVLLRSDESTERPVYLNSGGGEPSCASMRSKQFVGQPITLSSGGGEPSCVFPRSDESIERPVYLSHGGAEPSYVFPRSDESTEKLLHLSSEGQETSCVSTSNQSLKQPFHLSSGGGEPSCVFPRSDESVEQPILLSGGGEPSRVSTGSDQSIEQPLHLSSGIVSSDPEQNLTETTLQVSTLMEGPGSLQQDSYHSVEDVLKNVIERHKTSMKKKYESLFEQNETEKNKTLLNRVYAQLYIIEGESEEVCEEHEVLQMEKIPRKRFQDTPINCLDILQSLQGPERETKKEKKKDKENNEKRKGDKGAKVSKLRTVLTKGAAGIGKTVSVQKFILDWAEGKANQNVDFMFVLPFRELNLIKDDQYSLHGLLCDFHPELKDLDPKIYDELKTVFIFDGLDESRIPLNFEKCAKVSDITMTSSVGVLKTNLIKGELLPSALIWITSRPAATNKIPPQYIDRVTEIQGFNNPQKAEYFRKTISDESQATRIISHIKKARSLYIMCHIPIFCWISATVLQRIKEQHNAEIPKTPTEMYSHFLLTQTNIKNEKSEKEDERDPKKLLESNRAMILKLAELAFKQLMKGNVIFYEEDLRESGIDVTEASMYSGTFAGIFREECVLYQRKVYCFVHLSFQEFLAAVHVFHCYESKDMEDLQCFKPQNREWCEDLSVGELLKRAVDKAESQNGHLDLFLRFLLGISLESNQRLLQGLLTHTQHSSEKTREYIKTLIKEDNGELHRSLSTDRSINLFLCLSEMKDQSLSRELQEYMKSKKHSEEKLSPGQCSALAYKLVVSEEVLDELDLKKYSTSEEGQRRLIPAVSICRKAILTGCNLTLGSCQALCSALQSANVFLKELDLSNNDLQDSGVELLFASLTGSNCRLETLRLANCNLGGKACECLSSALQSADSSLRKLDFSNNDLQDSGVELLSAGLKSSHCKLEMLSLAICNLGGRACEHLGSALQSLDSSLKELDLSNNDLQDSGVELLSVGLKSSHCRLEILRLNTCNISYKTCESLESALQLVKTSLKELDLSNNDLQDSGVELLSAGLKSSHCRLEILSLANCNLGQKACEHLEPALQSSDTSLKELDLSNNDLQDSGVELLSAGLKSSHCRLEIIRLSGCMVTDEGCSTLASALKSNPSRLRELDLTYNYPGEYGVKLLQDSHCTLEKLQMAHGGKIRIKPGLKKYACDLTLDPNTAHTLLSLSEGNRKAARVGEKLPYPDHPDRFEGWTQVLSVESLTGRCYWEVEWDGKGVDIAVSYKGISRKGDGSESRFGRNNQSWRLYHYNNRYSVYHSDRKTAEHLHQAKSGRVGVYLDWQAETLSFYSIAPHTLTLTLLHTFHSTFTEPLYAGFRLSSGCSVRVCEIE